jgi:hypothetical protein
MSSRVISQLIRVSSCFPEYSILVRFTSRSYHNINRGTNLINLEIKRVIKGQLANLNIVTRGGAKIGVDAENLPQIQKAAPKEDRYDPLKQK